MKETDARRLLELSRAARWTFPSSSGTPVLGDEPWLAPLLAEQKQLPAAARALDPAAATELGAGAWRLWMISRDLEGGRAFVGAALAREGGTPRDRALALYGDGLFAFWQDGVAESGAQSEAALEAATAAGDQEALALANLGLSRSALAAGNAAAARDFAAFAREHARQISEPLGQAPLHLYAQSIRALGDYEDAAPRFRESLELNRRIGDPGMIAVELHNLGHVELHRGNVDQAEALFAELADRGGGDDAYSLALARLNEAALAAARGNRGRAAEQLEEIDRVLDESGTELAPDDGYELDWLRQRLTS
jgi:tetratricopeptide (TPR) repeat protein